MVEAYTEAATVDIWDRFLRGFKQDGKYVYFDAIGRLSARNRKTLYLNYDHLVQSLAEEEEFSILRKMVVYDTDEARDTLKQAAFALLKERDLEYAESIERVFRAEFMGAPIKKSMTGITVEDSGTFVKTTGTVQEYDAKAAAVIHSLVWKCPEGHSTETQGIDKPKKCSEKECKSVDLWKDEKRSRVEDYIRFRLAQRSDETFDKKEPTELDFETFGPDNIALIIERMGIGDYISVDGIVRTRYVKRTTGQGKAVGEPYIEACHVEPLPESQLITTDPALIERMRHVFDKKNEAEYIEKMINSVAPSIRIGRLLRLVILLLVIGSDYMELEDGTRVRGELQILLIGEPATAKSHISQWIRVVRERVLYNSGGKSTSVGLVGGYIQDRDGVGKIRSGVFGLARNGIVILDEFGDRPPADYQNLLEPLSDMQSVSIAKGTQYRSEVVNTGVLAITNPSTRSRYYDTDRNILENTNIPTTVLQRFDVTLIVRDVAEAEEDEAKARHYFNAQTRALARIGGGVVLTGDKPRDYFTAAEMRAIIQILREERHPRLVDSPEAVEIVVKWYMRTRGFKITINKDKGAFQKDDPDSTMDIPAADMRDLGAVMRLSQAHARLRWSDIVSEEDVRVAIEIVDVSLAEAGHHRTLEDGTKEYMKDSLEEHNRRIKERQQQQMRHIFEGALDALTWRKCYSLREGGCGGAGHVTPIGDDEPKPCQMCDNSSGYINEKFYKGDLIHRLRLESGEKPLIPGSSFEFLWNEYVKRRAIIPLGPNQFMNNTPRLMREPTYAKIAPADDARKDELRRKIAEMRPRRTDELNSL